MVRDAPEERPHEAAQAVRGDDVERVVERRPHAPMDDELAGDRGERPDRERGERCREVCARATFSCGWKRGRITSRGRRDSRTVGRRYCGTTEKNFRACESGKVSKRGGGSGARAELATKRHKGHKIFQTFLRRTVSC